MQKAFKKYYTKIRDFLFYNWQIDIKNSRIKELEKQNENLKATAKRQEARGDKLYADLRSLWGEAWKSERKLRKTQDWAKKTFEANKSLKEQIKKDKEYIKSLEDELTLLRLESDHQG